MEREEDELRLDPGHLQHQTNQEKQDLKLLDPVLVDAR